MTITSAAIREFLRETILSIKPLEPGFGDLADDALLFEDRSGEASPVKLDSLDVLDLAMSIGEEFGLSNDQFETLVSNDKDFTNLRTVNDITDMIIILINNPEKLSSSATV